MSCKLPFRSSEANAKSWLRTQGVIDQYRNILDYPVFVEKNSELREAGERKYGIAGSPFQSESGTYAVPNEEYFTAIDFINDPSIEIGMNPYIEALYQKRLSTSIQDLSFDEQVRKKIDKALAVYSERKVTEIDFAASRSTTYPKSKMKSYIDQKERYLAQAVNRVYALKANQKTFKVKDPATFKRIGEDIKTLNKLIAQLKDEIIKLGGKKELSPTNIHSFVKSDLDRLDQIIANLTVENIKEAKDIISFLSHITDTSFDKIESIGHPFLDKSVIFDAAKDKILPQDIEDYFESLSRELKKRQDELAKFEKGLIEDLWTNNALVKGEPGLESMTHEDLMRAKKGLKDIHWWDNWMMDIGQNTFADNGLMSQLINANIEHAYWKEDGWAKNKIEEIDRLLPGVVAEMQKLGHNLGFMNIKGTSWNIFKQKYADGHETGNMIDKYSAEWYQDYKKAKALFKYKIGIARSTGNPLAIADVMEQRRKWFKDNTEFLNVTLMDEVFNDAEIMAKYPHLDRHQSTDKAKIAAQRAKIVGIIGERHYKKIVESQVRKVKEYDADRKNLIDDLITAAGVANEAALSFRDRQKIKEWDYSNSPFLAAEYMAAGGTFTAFPSLHPTFLYTTNVPKDGYYDPAFKEIEANPVLLEFYETAADTLGIIIDKLGYEASTKLSFNSLTFIEKSVVDILLDKDLNVTQKVSASFRKIIEQLKQLIGTKIEGAFDYAHRNPVTGKPDYKVNDSFIHRERRMIKKQREFTELEFMSAFNLPTMPDSARIKEVKLITGRNVKYFNDETVLSLISKYTGKIYTSTTELEADYGEIIPIGKIIETYAVHQVARQKSFDLPKVLKTYVYLAARYHAKVQMQPTIELLKEHFDKIKDVETNKTGEIKKKRRIFKKGEPEKEPENVLVGERTHAKHQMEFAFQSLVLGNEGIKEWGVISQKLPDAPREKNIMKRLLKKYVGAILTFDGKLLSDYEKDLKANAKRAIASPHLTAEDKAKLQKMIDELGENFAASRFLNMILQFIRFKGLSYNLSSNITNFLEGQIANRLSAGIYFPTEYLNSVTPADLIAVDSIGKLDKGVVPEKALVAKLFVKKLDLLQDASNELQKTSAKTGISGSERIRPMYGTMKAEQYNQTPVVAAIMRDTKITAPGEPDTDLLHALEPIKLGGEWTFRLKAPYNTPENIEAWEALEGDMFYKFKSRASEVISSVHGRGYNELKKMAAKSTMRGRAGLMFKTWLPTEIYKRFAVEQFNLATGKTFKGRYRSLSPTSGAMLGTAITMSLIGFSPLVFVGGLASLVGAHYYGVKTPLGLLEENLLYTKILAAKFAGIWLNPLSRLITKKNLEVHLLPDDSALKATLLSDKFTETDYYNLQNNLQEIAIMAAFMALMVMVKLALWDDDDDKEDTRRMAHNIFMNRLMQISSNATMFSVAPELWKNATEIPVIKLVNDSFETLKSFADALVGDDVVVGGINTGESDSFNKLSKLVLPNIMKDIVSGDILALGFASQATSQFEESPFDRLALSNETIAEKDTKENRAQYKRQLIDAAKSKDEKELKKIQKEVDKLFPTGAMKDKASKDKVKKLLKAQGLTNKQVGERMKILYSPKNKDND